MFTIPTWRDVLEDPTDVFPQAEWDPVDIDMLLLGIGGDGVLNGCAVTPASPTGMLVDVASGQVAINGTVVDVAAQPDVVVSPADLSQPRADLVVVDEFGIVDVVEGDPFDQSPPFPGVPADTVPLAALYIPASLSTILSDHITPKDVPVRVPRADQPGWETITTDDDVDLLNDITLNPDSQLKFTMAANTRYRLRGRVMFESLNTTTSGQQPNVRFGFSGPGTATRIDLAVSRGYSFQASAFTDAAGFTRTYRTYETTGWPSANTGNSPIDSWFTIEGLLHNGATGGDFAITWAQNAVSTVINTTRLRGSWLEWQEA